ncbi:hypothetical protein LTR10_019773 [Elasticomyces elasticus]|uniref:Uncharacterized protein n=1 Tax=Exophiala sideris TaxID=1016849 RepID=A0ABR0JEH3_9EURO|nr:hypothetical protein LTR10_019773 [Elasticomyces elasticus]KAK5032100.1 hypothetical protein LTS07_004722 [Exophiala sideris]KAK5041027.1 hypothetical protein LTR13_003329 [Exophiala sideris]KAK5061639.1 hypothetical protein LTR69_004821 [Exophiala sideris]KAK5184338.1 hypothetical protein LTR44_003011 [Eurotiomycetes sp. CCFEE 6388]
MRVEVLREKNARVVQSLRSDGDSELWTVSVARGEKGSGSLSHAPVTDMEARGSFVSKDEANEAAKRVLREIKAEFGPDALSNQVETSGLVNGVVGRLRDNTCKVVDVRHQVVEGVDWPAAQGSGVDFGPGIEINPEALRSWSASQ